MARSLSSSACNAINLRAVRVHLQVDDGYASDEIMLRQPLSILTFTNTTRLMQNVPCPYVVAFDDNRQKVGSNVYKFPYRLQRYVGCAGGPGDLFSVRSSVSLPWSPMH